MRGKGNKEFTLHFLSAGSCSATREAGVIADTHFLGRQMPSLSTSPFLFLHPSFYCQAGHCTVWNMLFNQFESAVVMHSSSLCTPLFVLTSGTVWEAVKSLTLYKYCLATTKNVGMLSPLFSLKKNPHQSIIQTCKKMIDFIPWHKAKKAHGVSWWKYGFLGDLRNKGRVEFKMKCRHL